jgi:hypothetical protein
MKHAIRLLNERKKQIQERLEARTFNRLHYDKYALKSAKAEWRRELHEIDHELKVIEGICL